MTDSKTVFQRNEDLSGKWAAVCKAAWFDEVVVHARSVMMEAGFEPGESRGAAAFVHILKTICDKEEEPMRMPRPPLEHDLNSTNERKKPISK